MINIFFDVDETLVARDGNSYHLRPHAVEILFRLKKHKYMVYIWSRAGKKHADFIVDSFGLRPYVDDTFTKPPKIDNYTSDYLKKYITALPSFIVDNGDHLFNIDVPNFKVRSYDEPDEYDIDLLLVYKKIRKIFR